MRQVWKIKQCKDFWDRQGIAGISRPPFEDLCTRTGTVLSTKDSPSGLECSFHLLESLRLVARSSPYPGQLDLPLSCISFQFSMTDNLLELLWMHVSLTSAGVPACSLLPLESMYPGSFWTKKTLYFHCTLSYLPNCIYYIKYRELSLKQTFCNYLHIPPGDLQFNLILTFCIWK